MLDLPNITLVAMTSVRIEKTIKALEWSCKDINFGCVKLITHSDIIDKPSFLTVDKINKISNIDEWNHAIIFELPLYINTSYAILIHDDGFIVNPTSWTDEFLNYDYIGAPWPIPSDNYSYRDINNTLIRVGNSVSLRSKKLLDMPLELNLKWEPFHGLYDEDGFICVNNRHIYEKHGCRFADIDVAKHFSHETMIPEIQGIKPFAFHKWYGSNSIYPKF